MKINFEHILKKTITNLEKMPETMLGFYMDSPEIHSMDTTYFLIFS